MKGESKITGVMRKVFRSVKRVKRINATSEGGDGTTTLNVGGSGKRGNQVWY